MLDNNCNYCYKCLNILKSKFTNFKIDDIDALAIYDYDETMQQYLYQFKGCFDVELSDYFLYRYSQLLCIKYRKYNIVPIPSYIEDDETRGFNHVEEIFKNIKLPMLKLLEKTEHYKQSDHSQSERQNISKYIKTTYKGDLTNKKILLVDDVFTTGSTMRAAISLIKELKPKIIKVLVLSKTTYSQN